jgi:hypothetical protein
MRRGRRAEGGKGPNQDTEREKNYGRHFVIRNGKLFYEHKAGEQEEKASGNVFVYFYQEWKIFVNFSRLATRSGTSRLLRFGDFFQSS